MSAGRTQSPARTESWRVTPPVVTRSRSGGAASGASWLIAVARWSAGTATTTWRITVRSRKARQVRTSTGVPARSRNCLGVLWPKREPVPPAGMMTPAGGGWTVCGVTGKKEG